MALLDDKIKVLEVRSRKTTDCPLAAWVGPWRIIYHCCYLGNCIDILPQFLAGKRF